MATLVVVVVVDVADVVQQQLVVVAFVVTAIVVVEFVFEVAVAVDSDPREDQEGMERSQEAARRDTDAFAVAAA